MSTPRLRSLSTNHHSLLVLEAAASLFDALGAVAIGLSRSLDRHWRNARIVKSRNP
jgi:hypothetical protein